MQSFQSKFQIRNARTFPFTPPQGEGSALRGGCGVRCGSNGMDFRALDAIFRNAGRLFFCIFAAEHLTFWLLICHINMKKLLFAIFLCCAVLSAAAAGVAAGESINYRVMYKWGLVNKQAGRVNLSTRWDGPGKIKALLTARSEKWADAFYSVRDTLAGHMNISTMEPYTYEKITHEGGEYKRDLITYTRSGNNVKAKCQRWKQKSKNKPVTKSEMELEAEGLTLDMLSAFYYMRSLDYASMSAGHKTKLTVFSGKRKETLTITYLGEDTVEIDKTKYPCYKISFSFTADGGKKSSDDMEAWISTAADKIPLKLEGKLPVGKVQCFYMPS